MRRFWRWLTLADVPVADPVEARHSDGSTTIERTADGGVSVSFSGTPDEAVRFIKALTDVYEEK